MSERGSSKSRKAPVFKSPASKTPVTKGAAAKLVPAKGAVAKNGRKAARSASKSAAPSPPRKPAKASTRPPKQAAETAGPLDASSLLARVIKLESERDRLQAELATATGRIQALEESREQVVNRIDWVIDSLRNLVDD
ncbi:MAG: hypothetical protein ABI391_04485 [Hyphomicrobiaceae bacterium]